MLDVMGWIKTLITLKTTQETGLRLHETGRATDPFRMSHPPPPVKTVRSPGHAPWPPSAGSSRRHPLGCVQQITKSKNLARVMPAIPIVVLEKVGVLFSTSNATRALAPSGGGFRPGKTRHRGKQGQNSRPEPPSRKQGFEVPFHKIGEVFSGRTFETARS